MSLSAGARSGRDLAWVAFACLVVYVVVLGGSWIGIYAVPLRSISLALVVVGLAGWLVLAARRPEWRPASAIWPAIGLPLAAFALSTLASRFPRLGIEYLAWAVLLVALYLLLVRIMALDVARRRIGGLATALGLVLGTTYILWVVGLWIEWWALVGRLETPPLRPTFIGLTWGNPNAVLTVEVLLLLVAGAGLGMGTRARRTLMTALVLVTAAVVVLSGSRAGWLALAATLAIVGLPWLIGSAQRGAFRQAMADRRARLGLMAAALGIALVAVVLTPGIVARIEDGGHGGRPTYFAAAVRMFTEAPLLGTGPGTWAARRIVHTQAGELDYYIPHAHNIYLQTLAELGLLGALAGLVILACVAWLVTRALFSGDPVRRRWGWATLLGCVYLGLHSLFDSYANMPAVLLLLAIPIALLDGASDRRIGLPAALRPMGTGLSRSAVAILVAGCALSVLVLARAETVAFTHERAVELANRGEWQAAVGPATAAAEQDPALPPYQFTRGLVAAAGGDWEAAADAFAAAARADDLPQSWLGLAVAQVESRTDPADVAASLRRAYRVGVQQPAVAFAIGRVYDRLAMTAQADNAYLAALGQLPSLAADPTWTADPESAARFAAVIERALRSYPASAWELLLMSGHPERALELAQTSPEGALARSIVAAWGGDREAIREVLRDADANVLDTRKLAWAARVSARAGDAQGAARYRRLIAIGMPDSPGGYEVRIGRREAARDATVGSRASNYGTYMYRRNTPWDTLVPGLSGLVREEAPRDP